MGIFDGISSFFHPEDAYKEAGKASQQGWQQAQGFEVPFEQRGLDQYPFLQDAINKLMHPDQLESQWASGYDTSPYAKRELEMNKGQGLDAASSMGLMGSSGALSNIQQGAGDITSRDRQQYLNDLMQKYMQGIGLSSGIYNTGAGMGGSLGQQAIGQGETMAGLRYGQQAAPGALFGKLAGTALNFAYPGTGNAFTGQQGNSGFANTTNSYNR